MTTARSGALGLRVIGGFKLVGAVLLMALGLGLFRHNHADVGAEARHLVDALKLDPDNQMIHSAIEWASGVDAKKLRAIGVGTFLYALLYLVEGTGLVLKKPWAEYLTVVATGALIPLELWELWRRLTPIRLTILLLNLAIVAYLVYHLIRSKRAEAVGPAADI